MTNQQAFDQLEWRYQADIRRYNREHAVEALDKGRVHLRRMVRRLEHDEDPVPRALGHQILELLKELRAELGESVEGEDQ